MSEAEEPEEVWSWSDIKDQASLPEDVVPICIDGRILVRLKAAQAKLREALRQSDGTLGAEGVADLRAEISKIEEDRQEATRDFKVHAISYKKWRELVVAHPSDKSNRQFDAETFVPAAIAACCPHFTADEIVSAIEDDDSPLSTESVEKLFQAIWKLNSGDYPAPFTLTG